MFEILFAPMNILRYTRDAATVQLRTIMFLMTKQKQGLQIHISPLPNDVLSV
jgi:hypothetical protein